MDGYGVGEVAQLAHISVRTLHHYDEIGLLRPSARTSAGYRRYSASDLARLRDIVYYRQLDFGLEQIAAMLADPGPGRDARLREQHRLLRQRIARDQALLTALEKEMEARAMGISLGPEEQFEVFASDKFGGEYAAEAEQRWGDTDAWRESSRRTAAYTKDDWLTVKAEAEGIERGFADALRAGEPADGPVAGALAERHREHISRWFYDCSYETHRALAEMYVADERFTAHYDGVAPGLASYVRAAILANAAGR